ncbi:MAG: hypothetical protein WC867_03180 [Candidatus Pacearchaeota archaeon]|jgi:hypothetical protein
MSQAMIDPDQDIKFLLRPDLEELVRENEELSGGKYHRELEVFEEFSEKFGFRDLVERIGKIYQRIGKANAHSKREKVEKDRREDDFETYIARDYNIEQIEPGLVFIERQSRLKSGRPDIKAIDKNGNRVYIELKINEEDVESQIREIHRHLNGDKESRIIFVSPEIKPRIYYTFERDIENNRLSLYTVNEISRGQDYQINQFDPIIFNDQDRKEAERPRERKKRKVDTGIVDSGNSGRREKKNVEKNDSDEKQKTGLIFNTISEDNNEFSFEDCERISTGSINENVERKFTQGAPLFYQLMEYYDIFENQEEREKYKRPIQVSRKQLSMLEGLVSSPETQESYEELNKYKYWFIPAKTMEEIMTKSIMSVKDPKKRREFDKGYDKSFRLNVDITKLISREISLQAHANQNVKERYGVLRKLFKETVENLTELLNEVSYIDKDIKKYRGVLLDCIKKAEENDIENNLVAKISKGLYFDHKHFMNRAINDFNRLKLKRLEVLDNIDPNLSMAYFCHSPGFLFEPLGMFEPNSEGNIELSYDIIVSYFLHDHDFYKSIFDNLVVNYEEKFPNETKPKVNNSSIVAPEKTDNTQIINIPETLLRDSIVNCHSHHFSGYEPWINYLVEDITSTGYDCQEIELFSKSLSEARFPNRFRNRDSRPQMSDLETFSQDIKLKYLIHRKIPTGKELSDLYNADIKNGD